MHTLRIPKLTVTRHGYTWGVLWELVRIHYLEPKQGITPAACRSLMGRNVTVGPNVKTIILESKLGESSVPDLGKAEYDAQVRGFVMHLVFSGLMDPSLHGGTLILKSHCLVVLLPVFWSMVAGWSSISRLLNHSCPNNNHPSSVLQPDLVGGLAQIPL